MLLLADARQLLSRDSVDDASNITEICPELSDEDTPVHGISSSTHVST